MKDSTLQSITSLLDVLRSYSVLEEIRPAAFLLDGRDFIHFHETEGGAIADVLLVKGGVRMPVSSDAEQAELLGRVEQQLSSLQAHDDRRRAGSRRHRDRGV